MEILMEYEDIVREIQKAPRFGSLPGIKNSEKMLAAVGNPQKCLPFVHVAGTNGKGSTVAFLCAVLTEAGYKTGMFTSPHLEEFTERISVGGKQIPKEDVVRLGSLLLEQDFGLQPTMSDYCFLMAVLYFKEQNCDLVILETGLGGRLDSTNAMGTPLVAIITKIGYDHTKILGNTLSQIALEKAGILKPGCLAVTESQEPEVEEVFRRYCGERQIPLTIMDKNRIQAERAGYHISMPGSFQRENALAAVLGAKELEKQGYVIPEEAIKQGIGKAKWPGRMELLSEKPFFLVDGAHNGNGTAAMVQGLKELYPGEKFRFIMGVLEEKDYEQMADYILPIASQVITVTPENNRALQGERLASYMKKKGMQVRNCLHIQDIVKECLLETGNMEDEVKNVAFGSLYFIGTVRKIILNQKMKERVLHL